MDVVISTKTWTALNLMSNALTIVLYMPHCEAPIVNNRAEIKKTLTFVRVLVISDTVSHLRV